MNKIYDCHTHINSFEQLLWYSEQSIVPIVNVRSCAEYKKLKSWQQKIEDSCGGKLELYFSVGVHPWDVDNFDSYFGESYEALIQQADFLGEIGLDNVWAETDIAIQQKYFLQSLELANKYKNKVILHTKGMELEIYKELRNYDLDYIVHWYSCENYIENYINLGSYFTVGPAVLFDNNVQKVVVEVPIEKLLFETDGKEAVEWLVGKELTNEELNAIIEQTFIAIAELKNINVENLKTILKKNSQKILRSTVMEFKINAEQDFLYHGETEESADAYIIFTDNEISKVFVDPIYRGQGVAGKMMQELVTFARNNKVKVTATCPYAVSWFEKNEEQRDVLA